MIFEALVFGFFSAFGWWGANHYAIEPYFPPAIERKEEKKQEKKEETKEETKEHP